MLGQNNSLTDYVVSMETMQARRTIYEKLIAHYFEAFGGKIDQKEIMMRTISLNREMILYASNVVLLNYLEFVKKVRETGESDLSIFGRLVQAIRYELSGEKTNEDTILDLIFADWKS